MSQPFPTLEIDTLSYSLEAAVVSIGRADDNMVVLDDPSVSGHHAVIEQSTDGIVIRDLGSTNGTKVNGMLVTEAAISDGDQVCFGSVVAVLRKAWQPELKAATRTNSIPEHILNALDEQLQAGLILQADYDSRVEALEAAERLIRAKSGSVGTAKTEAFPGATPPPLPKANSSQRRSLLEYATVGLARIMKVWNALPFPDARHFAMMLGLMVVIYKTPPVLAGPAAFGYIFGALASVIPYAVGWFRRSSLTGRSTITCLVGGALTAGFLAIPVAIYWVVQMFREKRAPAAA